MKLNAGKNGCFATTLLMYLSGFALGRPLLSDDKRIDQVIDFTGHSIPEASLNRYQAYPHSPLRHTLVAAALERELLSRGLPKPPSPKPKPAGIAPAPALPPPRPVGGAPAAGIRPPGVSGLSTSRASGSRPAAGVAPPSPPRANAPSPKPERQPIPLDKNPGSGNGGVGVVPEGNTKHDYETKGRDKLNEYEAKVASNSPDKVGLDVREIPGYKIDEQTVLSNDRQLKALKDFGSSDVGFSLGSSPSWMTQVMVNDRASGDLINRGTYDKEGKFIVFQDAFKEVQKDIKPNVEVSEMGIQNFKNVAGDKARNLQAVYLKNVQNVQLWDIVRQNYNDMKQPFEQVLTFQRGTPQFDRIMGRPNFSSKFYAFGDHHNALGNKIPYKVVVSPKQVPGSDPGLNVAVAFQ